MNRKIIHLLLASTLFLAITAATTPLGNTVTWSGETRLTTYPDWDIAPSIAQMKDGRIWVVWQSRIGSNFDIFYTIHNWSSWSDQMPLTTDPSQDVSASTMQTNDGTIWLFWASTRNDYYDLFYKISSDNGSSWSNPTQLTENSGIDWAPSVIQAANGTIWVVWQSSRNDNFDLFYKISSDNGSSWSNATQLTTNVYNDEYPSIAQMKNGTIWVVWEYNTGTDLEIFYKTYDGSWSNSTQLTDGPRNDGDPWIMQARDGTIWIFWSSDRREIWDPEANEWVPQFDIFYKISSDGGASWSADIQLTDLDWNEYRPSAAQISDKKIWITWQSNKDDNYDIYYKTSSEILVHDIAIIGVTPYKTTVRQGLTLKINVTVTNEGDYTETFNVTVYYDDVSIENQTVISLAPTASKNLTFSWDTTRVTSSLNYTIRAEASVVPDETDTADNIFVDGKVYVEIAGDVDGDGDVDSYDFKLFAGAYGSSVGQPAYNPDCDLDGDGDVDSDDFYLFAGNYGKGT